MLDVLTLTFLFSQQSYLYGYDYPAHLTGEATEAQRVEVPCSRSHIKLLDPGLLVPWPGPLHGPWLPH